MTLAALCPLSLLEQNWNCIAFNMSGSTQAVSIDTSKGFYLPDLEPLVSTSRHSSHHGFHQQCWKKKKNKVNEKLATDAFQTYYTQATKVVFGTMLSSNWNGCLASGIFSSTFLQPVNGSKNSILNWVIMKLNLFGFYSFLFWSTLESISILFSYSSCKHV